MQSIYTCRTADSQSVTGAECLGQIDTERFDYRELVRQGEKEEEGEREIESPWGPIRGSSEGL